MLQFSIFSPPHCVEKRMFRKKHTTIRKRKPTTVAFKNNGKNKSKKNKNAAATTSTGTSAATAGGTEKKLEFAVKRTISNGSDGSATREEMLQKDDEPTEIINNGYCK